MEEAIASFLDGKMDDFGSEELGNEGNISDGFGGEVITVGD